MGPIIGGSILFGTMYAFSAFAGLVGEVSRSFVYDGPRDTTSYGSLFIPAVGPFMQLGRSSSSGAASAILLVDGVAQCAGLALLGYGIFSKRTIFVRQDVALAPVIGGGTTGAALVGTF